MTRLSTYTLFLALAVCVVGQMPRLGLKYVTRTSSVVGPLTYGDGEMEDHWTDGYRYWHDDGACCGDPAFDLVGESAAL